MAPTTTSPTSAGWARREPTARALRRFRGFALVKLPALRGRKRAAFTLIELIVVVSIIVILMSLIAPMILRAYRNGRLTRIAGDLQAVSQGLELYKGDFGDYPRIPLWPAVGLPAVTPAPVPGEPIPNTGAAILGKALMGLGAGDGLIANGNPDSADPPVGQNIAYPKGTLAKNNNNNPNDPANPPRFWVALKDLPPEAPDFTNSKKWAYFNPLDGADGPGFRTQKTIDLNGDGIPDTGGGKVHGPYLQPDVIKVSGTYLLDHERNPIVYFPTRPGKHDLTRQASNEAQPYVDRFPLSPNGPPAQPYINVLNNFEAFRHETSDADDLVRTRIRVMLGDHNANGYIDSQFGTETPIDKPYVLWSAGLDEKFGPRNPRTAANQTSYETNRDLAQDCDDVTNIK
jgi:prepilin-type N-terminal cleavage/methylation domain-containing protein